MHHDGGGGRRRCRYGELGYKEKKAERLHIQTTNNRHVV